jgi:hypothetical protein
MIDSALHGTIHGPNPECFKVFPISWKKSVFEESFELVTLRS